MVYKKRKKWIVITSAMLCAVIIFLLIGFMAFRASTSGTVLEKQPFESQALQKTKYYSIYLPPGYYTSNRSYPTVYLLHGAGEDGLAWIWNRGIVETLDILISESKIVPMIVVMPDAGHGNKPCSDNTHFYVNRYDGTANYEDYIVNDLVSYIDATYRTIPDRLHRASAGNSMGGYGALSLAMKHIDKFSVVAVNDPALIKGIPPKVMMETFLGESSGWAFGKPFNEEYWIENSPFTFVNTAKNLEKLDIYFDVGDDDRFGLYEGAAYLHIDLVKVGIKHEFRIYDGDHGWEYEREHIKDALIFISTSWSTWKA